MPSLHLTCPKSGLHWTVTDDYTTTRFRHMIHPHYNDLPALIRQKRTEMPQSYLVAGIFYYLDQKGLIANAQAEPAMVRPVINASMASHFDSPTLYKLYCRCRDTGAALKTLPKKVCLLSLLDSTPQQIFESIMFVVGQRISKDEFQMLYGSEKTHKASPKPAPRVNMSMESVQRRIIASFQSLVDQLEAVAPDQIPEYYGPKMITKMQGAVRQYSMMPERHQVQFRELLGELYTLARTNGLISVDDILYKSYTYYLSILDKGLITSSDDLSQIL